MNLFSTSRGRLSVVAIAIVPLLYSAAYLGAFWNPYGHLNRIPIAVVNDDRASESRTLIHDLREQLTVHVEDPAKARQDLANGRVGMIMDIPPNFSEDLQQARPVSLHFQTNPATNYLTSVLMEREATQVADNLAMTARGHIVDHVNQGLGTLSRAAATVAKSDAALTQGIYTLANEDAKLHRGARPLASGEQRLGQGLASWNAGVRKIGGALGTIQDGSQKAAEGSRALSYAATQIAAGQQQLAFSTEQVAQHEEALRTGWQTLYQHLQTLSQGSQSLVAIAEEDSSLTRQIQRLMAEPTTPQRAQNLEALIQQQTHLQTELVQAAETMGIGTQSVLTGSRTLNGDMNALTTGLQKTSAAGESLSQATTTWAKKTASWNRGVDQVNQGLNAVRTNFGKLQTASSALMSGQPGIASGFAQLSDGAGSVEAATRQLAQKMGPLSSGVTRLATALSAMKGLLQHVKSPVTPRVTSGSGNYGTGMAPYFLGLSLWVGAVVATVLVPGGRYQKRALVSRTWQSFWVAGLQILLLGGGTALVLPLHPVHPLGYAVGLLGIGFVWWAVIRLLVEKFGDAGRIFGIVLLVVQLASSGGTYPVVLSPGLFQAIHPYLPMTWAVQVLRWTLSNGYPGRVFGDAIRLAALGLAALGLVRWLPAQWLFEAPVLRDSDPHESAAHEIT